MDSTQSQYLTFFLGDEEYAVGILRAKEIIQYDVVTRVPGTPGWIRGVINLRGSVVPVLDLAVKFALPETEASKSTCIVIAEVELEGERLVMGVLADAVSQVIDLLPSDIEPTPAFGTRVHVDYLLGMGKLGKKFVLILDIDKVLSTEELRTAADVEPESAAGDTSASSPEAGLGAEQGA
jgi:purine-binding chemotaxis protein CheW